MAQRHRHDPSKSFVGFVVGDVAYAVSIHAVREISNPLEVVALPRAPFSVAGVADYRGEVVPVVSLRQRFGLEGAPPGKAKWIIVDAEHDPIALDLRAKGRAAHVALVVDAVTEVFGNKGAGLKPSPDLGGGERERGILGVTLREGELVFVLDPRAFRGMVAAVERRAQP
jgi:purine-binding chemotaxis protein CheW